MIRQKLRPLIRKSVPRLKFGVEHAVSTTRVITFLFLLPFFQVLCPHSIENTLDLRATYVCPDIYVSVKKSSPQTPAKILLSFPFNQRLKTQFFANSIIYGKQLLRII